MIFLVLYVDDILLIGNDIGTMKTSKVWLVKEFDMKDLGKANYVLGIQIIHDQKNKPIAFTQTLYIDKILSRCNMQDSKKRYIPFRH